MSAVFIDRRTIVDIVNDYAQCGNKKFRVIFVSVLVNMKGL
jgi:hypothetical protein